MGLADQNPVLGADDAPTLLQGQVNQGGILLDAASETGRLLPDIDLGQVAGTPLGLRDDLLRDDDDVGRLRPRGGCDQLPQPIARLNLG